MSNGQSMPVRRQDSELAAGMASAEFLSHLPENVAIVRMENDSMIAMAMTQPRDYTAIVGNLKQQLQVSKRFALAAMYSKPVGKFDKCPSCGRDTFYKDNCPGCNAPVPQKYATGLSVRSTEAMFHAYGHAKLLTSHQDLPGGDKVKITCQVSDFSTGIIISKDAIISKSYKTRRGEIKTYDDDRFYNVVLKAKMSILKRDTQMEIIPPAIRFELEDCVEEEREKYLDDATVKKIVSNFQEKGVSIPMLEKHFGKRIENFTKAERGRLASIWTSLVDEEATVESIFGGEGDDAGPKTSAAVSEMKADLERQKAERQTQAPAERPAGRPASQPNQTESRPDPLAPDPSVGKPKAASAKKPAAKPPEIAQEPTQDEPGLPFGSDGGDAPGEPAAIPGGDPEPDGQQQEPEPPATEPVGDLMGEDEPSDGATVTEAELKAAAWSEAKNAAARIRGFCAKQPKVESEFCKSFLARWEHHGLKGKKVDDDWSLDSMNSMLQDLAELEEIYRGKMGLKQ